ncbi:FkbM family methyltransferase [Uliginosibacterium sp. TH139]|uniref:FkbM family methyltransferase n=1 Tax=Uliginosibacterium sp. TH139 TaxID=2067453 RepID=UPI0013042FF5|nr:FkbM family methyltransferase [Uliginosibacterium sp. TH139]
MKISLPWGRLFRSADAMPAEPSAASASSVAAPAPAIPVRRLVCYCDGGFGNRFNALVTGLILARRADLPLEVVWPVNNWCGARFGELFDSPLTVIERELASFVAEKDEYQYLMTEDHLQQGVSFRSPLGFEQESELLACVSGDDKPVFLYTPLIPACLPPDEVLAQVRALQIRPEIQRRAEAFLVAKGLQGEFFGLQIRKTDFGANAADDENLFNLVKSLPDRRFFVCSDDAGVEQRFASLANVAVHAKQAYVEKLNPGDWMDPTQDCSGRIYHGNINRSAASVIDAVVDLLILSHSKVVRTSGSTFLSTALLLQAARTDVATAPVVPQAAAASVVPAQAYKMSLPLFDTIRALGLPAPAGILQVGASYGQEMQYFLENGIRAGLFIEPLAEPFAHLASVCRQVPGYIAMQALCADTSGQTHTFHVASNGGMSSSILKPAQHLQVFDYVKFPTSVELVSHTLDEVMAFVRESGHGDALDKLDTLYMDTQGAELRIMVGAPQTLRQINYIFTEVMRGEMYEKQASFQSVCAWLDVMGFTLNNVYFGPGHTGDALFIRKSLLGL